MLMCSGHFNLHFNLLVIKLLLIVLKMKLYPLEKQTRGLNFLKLWQRIMLQRREHHNAYHHIKYVRKNMNTINQLTYLHLQY